MQLDSVRNIIHTKNFPPILFLFGEEEFLVDEATRQLVNSAQEAGMDEFNTDVLDGEDITPEQLVQMASAFPMMGTKRLVLVKRFDKVVSGRRSKNDTKSQLAEYFRNPSPSTFLVLKVTDSRTVNEELKGIAAAFNNPKQRDKANEKVKKLKFPFNMAISHADWVEYPKLHERDIPSWIANRLKSMGYTISPQACELIVAQVGGSLRDISNEIEKILTYIENKTAVSEDDVMSVVGASRTYNVFELQRSVGERSVGKALDILLNMLRNDRQELLIISLLTRYFVALWKLTDARRLSTNSFELSKAIGVSSFFIPEYLSALNRYSPAEIERAFFALQTADRTIKSTSADVMVVMQKMLLSIMDSGTNA